MMVEHLVWVVLMWLFIAAALGFGLSWLIQEWRYAEARHLGQSIESESLQLKALQDELLEQLHRAETALLSANTQDHNADYTQAQRFEALKIDLAKKQEEQAAKAQQLLELQTALAAKEQHAQRDLSEIRKLQADLSQQHANYDALRHELNAVRGSLKESEQSAETLRLNLLDTQKSLTLAEAKHLQQEAALNELSLQLVASNEENALLMENVRSLQNHIAERERQISDTLESLPAMPDATQEEREIAFLRQQLAEANVRVLELDQTTQQLQLALVSAKQEPRSSTTPVQVPAQTHESAVMITDDELVSYRLAAQRLQELEDALAKAVSQAQERKTEVAGLKGRIQDLEATVAQMWKQPQYQTVTELHASNETAA